MTADQLEERLILFGVNCSLLTRKLPANEFYDAKNVSPQLIRSSTSPGFHYGETRAAESTRDFLHKLKVNLKELREAKNELRYIKRMKYVPDDEIAPLLNESQELVSIFLATTKKVAQKLK